MKPIPMLGVLAIAFASSALGGCVHHQILAFDDNPKQPLTTMQVMTTKSYWIFSNAEHQFFTCSDKGNSLECKRVCGGNTDLTCPFGAIEADGTPNTAIR